MPKQTFFNLPDDKKQKITTAAYEVFTENEYKDVSIRNITAKSNISIGSFYKYFYDKDDLYLYLLSNIEKKIYARQKEETGYFLMDSEFVPIEKICTDEEIKFNQTWYNAPIEVMMKFYFGDYGRELNIQVKEELIQLKESGRLKDNVNIEFAFHIYVTTMLNILIYFRDNNITDNTEKLRIKKEFYTDWFLTGILNKK